MGKNFYLDLWGCRLDALVTVDTKPGFFSALEAFGAERGERGEMEIDRARERICAGSIFGFAVLYHFEYIKLNSTDKTHL